MPTAAQIDRAERIALNHDLAEWNRKEAEAERRAALIEQRTKDLMQVGKEFYPWWTFSNFTEAIENAPEAELRVCFACTVEAVAHGLRDDHKNHMAMVAMRQMVERYWTKCAAVEAERQLRDE